MSFSRSNRRQGHSILREQIDYGPILRCNYPQHLPQSRLHRLAGTGANPMLVSQSAVAYLRQAKSGNLDNMSWQRQTPADWGAFRQVHI